jgi:hypothetical protein
MDRKNPPGARIFLAFGWVQHMVEWPKVNGQGRPVMA